MYVFPLRFFTNSCVYPNYLINFFFNMKLLSYVKLSILVLQEKIIDELGAEMDSTSNRLDFVQVSFVLNFDS